LKRPFVWIEMGAFWRRRKRIVVTLHGLDVRELTSRESTPAFLKVTDVVNINELDTYFRQLKERVRAARSRHE
jgi:hypothetical protein